MNAAAGAAVAAAAAQQEADRKVLALLKDRGADRPSRAEAIGELEKRDRKRVDKLVKKELLARHGEDRIYLTEKGVLAAKKPEVNGGQVMLILLIAFSICATVIAVITTMAD